MKKKLFSIGMLALACSIAFTSCKKDDDGGSSSGSAKDRLTSGQWRMTAGTITISSSIGGSNTQDIFSSLDACEKDDLTKFETGGTVTMDEGASKCNTSDPQTYSGGTWALDNNDTKLILTDGTAETYDIEELSSSTLKVSQSTSQSAGGISVTTKQQMTFTKN